MNALLLSSTVSNNGSYLGHAEQEIKKLFSRFPLKRVLVLPYAQFDYDTYIGTKISPFFEDLGITVDSLHKYDNPRKKLETADFDVLYVNGGNTFKLLKYLQDHELIEIINKLIREQNKGYLSASAGTSIAGLTIKTSNDMPITWPSSLDSLGLVPFQINCHFVSGRLREDIMMETREKRISEFHLLNSTPVVGLAESNWIELGDQVCLRGETTAPVFYVGSTKEWEIDTAFTDV